MKWKLIFMLSLPALAMAFATVYWIPTRMEPFFWLAIFVFCAYVVSSNVTGAGRLFGHGFCIALFNCLWITTVHILLKDSYLQLNPEMKEMYDKPFIASHPTMSMAIMGGIIGLISGVVLGVFCLLAGRLRKKPA